MVVGILARYAARFSVRALDVTRRREPALGGRRPRALAAAVLLAFVPRLPSADAPSGLGLTTGSARSRPGTNRRLRAFAVTQIAPRSCCSPAPACW